MNDLLFRILTALVYVAVAAVVRYLIPLITTKLKESKYAFLADIIMDAVRAQEQIITGPDMGAKRKDLVTQYAQQMAELYHIPIEPAQIDTLIEAAVQAMNAEKIHIGDAA